jgi:hypothetical protein
MFTDFLLGRHFTVRCNIKINLRETGFGDMNSIEVTFCKDSGVLPFIFTVTKFSQQKFLDRLLKKDSVPGKIEVAC